MRNVHYFGSSGSIPVYLAYSDSPCDVSVTYGIRFPVRSDLYVLHDGKIVRPIEERVSGKVYVTGGIEIVSFFAPVREFYFRQSSVGRSMVSSPQVFRSVTETVIGDELLGGIRSRRRYGRSRERAPHPAEYRIVFDRHAMCG